MPIIRHFRKEKETGAEMLPAIVSGNGPVSYWPLFFLDPNNNPKRL